MHLRGLDKLTTKDIRAFASEYFPAYHASHIEWIDDTSANIVYEAAEIAQQALRAFAAVPVEDVSQIPALESIQAKPFPLHPETSLQVRLAVAGDRKQAGARERSRFYLFNPEYDPAERRKANGAKYRDRGDGGYRSQRYDDKEQRRRERDPGFDASLYDDDEVAVARRAGRQSNRRDSSSGNDSRSREFRSVRPLGAAGRELFRDRENMSGRLRNRSASPLRDSAVDRDGGDAGIRDDRNQDRVASANRLKAKALKAQLKSSESTKELFPLKTIHRRSAAFDAADETADLFAGKMAVPFTDGSNDVNGSLASRITSRNTPGFSIRGSANARPDVVQSFSIKGTASGPKVKELFPTTLGDNSGKELFSDRLEGRGRRRQKAEDLFY